MYLVYIIFILTVAMAAGGVVISSKLRNSFRHEIFSTLLYYQVFIYTFGFYGIWGQVAIRAFLSSYISSEILGRLSDIALLMGLPFLLFAWLMIFRFSLEISGRKPAGWFLPLFLVLNFSILLILGFILTRTVQARPASLIRYYFMTFDFIYLLTSSMLILFPVKKSSVIHDYDRRIIGPAILIIMLSRLAPLVFYNNQVYMGLIFIFIFFAGNTFLPVYLNYGTLPSAFGDVKNKDLTFEDFCRKFEVSPRETDIVRELCNGLSNKEISEKLFISLQTVKDHTHRIYVKTNVRSRVQLINIVKELRKT